MPGVKHWRLPERGPLDSASERMLTRYANAAERLQHTWTQRLGRFQPPHVAPKLSGLPLLASPLLIQRLNQRLAHLHQQLHKRLLVCDDPLWPHAGAATVLCADLAVVHDEHAESGWDLRWVEFQTFTSVLATLFVCTLDSLDLWPDLSAYSSWGMLPTGHGGHEAWLSVTRQWLFGAEHGREPGTAIMLDHAPERQFTRFDFAASDYCWQVPTVGPESLTRRGQHLYLNTAPQSGGTHTRTSAPINHIANRVILHELPDRTGFERMLSDATLNWHSHPAWYYRVNKGYLPTLALPDKEACVIASQWRSLKLSPQELVLKHATGYGGTAVLTELSADQIDQLNPPHDWIAQPRFRPYPWCIDPNGEAVFGEIRCILALTHEGSYWVAGRLVRNFRDQFASMRRDDVRPGVGMAPLFG